MRRSIPATLAVLAIGLTSSALAKSAILSCSEESVSDQADRCQVPAPGGLFVFKQRFEPDVGGDAGSWGIDVLEVLDCTTQRALSGQPFTPSYSHEEIASHCLRSPHFGGEEGFERAEREWAQSEVGEGVEEVWERTWNTAGRLISTLAEHCHTELDLGHEVPDFFHVLHQLHGKFQTARLLSEADITPSPDMTYSLAELQAALATNGHAPLIICDNTTLSSVHWPLQVKGPFQSGDFVASSLLERQATCPQEGIRYPQTTTHTSVTTSNTFDPIYRPTPRPVTKAHDESRLYYQSEPDPLAREDPKKLGLFKARDEGRGDMRKGSPERAYGRDEL